MSKCPCGSKQSFSTCCEVILQGAPPETAEALMRARYTALTVGDIKFLSDTLSDDIRAGFDEIETQKTSKNAQWKALDIREIIDGGVHDETGSIEYVARFRLDGQSRIHHERSKFARENGRWLCVGGQVNPKSSPRQTVQVGRNDPCLCGSGKKYKKCCGG